jgi:hypothetical protein
VNIDSVIAIDESSFYKRPTYSRPMHNMFLTPEKCKADFAYTTGDMGLCLPVQTKSATLKKDGKRMNAFHNTQGYENMVLICRPMRRMYVGSAVLPGSLAPKDLGLTLSDDSKYGKYIVPDPLLKEFMNGIGVYERTVLGASTVHMCFNTSTCVLPSQQSWRHVQAMHGRLALRGYRFKN